MSSKTRFGNEVSGGKYADEAEYEAVDEEPDLRPSVEQEIHAKVDRNHPDARPEGMTLEAEERFVARENEIRRTRQRWDRRQSSDREARTRDVVRARTRYATEEPPQDPRERLSREELAEVNQHAARIAEALDGRSRAAAAWRLAREVLEGVEMLEAVLAVREELQATPGISVPIAEVGEVPRSAVDIQGRIAVLWEPSHHKVQQVGLIEDESGRIRFTVWERSNQPWVSEGERVRLRNVEKSWYEGRVSVAATGYSQIEFPERGEWWTE